MAEREGILAGVAETKIANIPVGAAAAGALIAGLADSLIAMIPTGTTTKVPPLVVRAGAAWATIKWGPKFFGTAPAQAAGLFLAYDAVQELFDFRGLTKGLFKKVKIGELGQEEKEKEIELIGDGEEEIELIGAGEEEELPPELLGLGEVAEEKKLVLVA